MTLSKINEKQELLNYQNEVLSKARETMSEVDIAYVEEDLRSPCTQEIAVFRAFADIVEKGQILAYVGETPVEASITGVLRGIIKEGYNVPVGMKIADIDPRKEEKKNCFTISDKARCIAGSVVEILLSEGVLPD